MKNLNEIVYLDAADPKLKEFISDKLIPDLLEWCDSSRYEYSIIPFFQSQGVPFDFILSLSKDFNNLKIALQKAFDTINTNFFLAMNATCNPVSIIKSAHSFPLLNNDDQVPEPVIVFAPVDDTVIPKKIISNN